MDSNSAKPQNIQDLENLLGSAVNGYALIDNSFNLIIFNRKMEKFLQNISDVKIEKDHSILEGIPDLFKKEFNSLANSAFQGKPVIEQKHFSDDFSFKISVIPYSQNKQKVETVLVSIADTSSEWQMMKLAAENAEIMDSVFDTSSGIALVGIDGAISKVNSAFCRILGYTTEELLGTNYFDLVAQEDKKASKDSLATFFSDHKSFSGEVKLIHKSGKIIMILKQITYLKNEAGKPLIIISIADISERKYAEQELKAREMFYKALIERSSDMKILTTADGYISFGSAAVTKFLGYSIDEFEGHHITEFVPTEDIPQLLILVDEVISQPGNSVLIQQRIKHKNGEWRCCEGTVTNLLNDPNVGNLVANFRDVTEKRLATELLKTSEANLRAVFNSVDIGFVLLDTKMQIMLCNSVAADWSLVTFNKQLKKGNSFMEYISEGNEGTFTDNFFRILENTVFNSEVSYKISDGQILWYHVRMSPVLNEYEEVTGVCITASNITARKTTEIEKEKITQDLIKRNKDLQQFNYIVSHNLRAPTANIMALTDMLKNFKNLSKADKAFILDGLNTSSHQLDMVIRDLNQILQIDNTIGEKREWVNFSEILKELLLTIDPLIQKESAIIVTDFSEVYNVRTIRLYLYSIFYNLISNSLKYRNPFISPVITIKSKKIAEGVELSFSDNGIGIDLVKHQNKMFGLYNRFHLHKEGKGMGLFMVKSQVEALGGNIRVQSEPGKGTEFIIELKNENTVYPGYS